MSRKTKFRIALVVVAICVAYSNSFQNGFHFDDFHTVVDNPAVRSLRNVPRFFTDATTFSVLPANRTYRPVVSTSLAVDYWLGRGYVPLWFHASTFVLFLVLVWLLFELYRLLLDKVRPAAINEWLALFGAAWFGLHPAMAETVNYVIQRGDLDCTLGCVAALYLFARYPERRKTGLYLLPFTLAMLSKPPAAVFPLLLVSYGYFFETLEQPPLRRLRAALVSATPAIVATVVLLVLQSAMTPKTFMPSLISAWDYRMVQPYVWARYAAELFLPLHLNVDTDLGAISSYNPQALMGLIFLGVLLAAIVVTARRRVLYPIAFGLLWFVETQLPTSLYPLSEVENDHRMFFSFAGLILAVVWAAWLLIERWIAVETRTKLRPAFIAMLLVVLAGYGYGVWKRNAVWHDEESLWLDDVQKSPHNGRGLMIYGLTQMNKGAYPVALDYFTRALEYTPNYATLEVNLGIVNGAMADQVAGGDQARTAETERHFQRAILLTPKDDATHAFYGRWLEQHSRYAEAIAQLNAAIALNPARSFPHETLIETYNREGDAPAAREAAQETLAAIPDDAPALMTLQHPAVQGVAFWINLSLSQYKQGLYQESIDSAKHALALDPKSVEAYTNIGAGYGSLGQWDEAIRNEDEALKLKPDYQLAKNNVALYMQEKAGGKAIAANAPSVDDLINESLRFDQAGKYDESIEAARKALKIDPNSAEAWNNIAAAYEAMHRWDPAIDAAKKAVALKPDFQLAKNNLAWSISEKAAKH